MLLRVPLEPYPIPFSTLSMLLRLSAKLLSSIYFSTIFLLYLLYMFVCISLVIRFI